MSSQPNLRIDQLSDNLIEYRKGFWISRNESRNISYPVENHEIQNEFQQKSFWYTHRSKCISKLFDLFPSEMILDVGGSNGNVASILNNKTNVTILEPGIQGAENAEKKGFSPIILSSFEDASFKENMISSIGLFDVLEHIEKDAEFLHLANKTLKSNGRIYLTVPAYKFLWSSFDTEVGHYRRYTLNGLKHKLRDAGFEIEYSTYIFSILPIPMFIIRKIRNLFGIKKNDKKDHVSSFTGKFLTTLFIPELFFINNKMLIPFGSSCMIVAKKTVL